MNRNKGILFLLAIIIFIIPGAVFAQDDDIPTVGILLYDAPTFIDEMTNLGYIEGENINYMTLNIFEYPIEEWGEQTALQTQAMLDADVDLFAVLNDTDAFNLRQRTDKPIVFSISDDPVATGAVADLTVPGGNTTGLVSNRHHERRLQLLTEIDPQMDTVYYLYAAFALEGEDVFNSVHALGEELGIDVIGAPVTDSASGIEAIANAPDTVDWFFLTPYTPFDVEFTDALIAASRERHAPIATYFGSANPGMIVNYGPDFIAVTRQTAGIVDNVLRGANPGELPVIIAENSLVINLEEAELVNFEVPVAILRQADQIVRAGYFEELNAGMMAGTGG